MNDPLLNSMLEGIIHYGPWLLSGIALVWIFLIPLLAIFAFGPLWKVTPWYCLRYILTAPIGLFLKLLTTILSPLLSLISVILNRPNLPMPLYLFQTHDQSLDAEKQAPWGRPTSAIGKWWWRMKWLCRNPAYGFLHYMLGIKSNPNAVEKYYPVRAMDMVNGPLQRYSQSAIDKDGVPVKGGPFSCRGKFGPFYIWFGWKLITKYPDGRRMMALGLYPVGKYQPKS
jgi:hypothetical protein